MYYNNHIRGYLVANNLNTDQQIAVIAALAEGCSIRSIERMTGIHRDTIMRLSVKVGVGCTRLMDETMRDLPCTRLEMDEIWGFVGKKEKHLKPEDSSELGSVWTFCAIDAGAAHAPPSQLFRTKLHDARDATRRARSRTAVGARLGPGVGPGCQPRLHRSEERRVGKECRSRWS